MHCQNGLKSPVKELLRWLWMSQKQFRGTVKSQNQDTGSESDTLAVFVVGGEGRIEMGSGGLFE